ncbi:MAG TPA: hypothetical protein VMW57_03895 [Methyloceanibacter sp.]|nr:hypothetical protein [Methyloceanibacter sp.]
MFLVRSLGLSLFAALGLVAGVAAVHAADATLGEAVKKADSKYLEAPETGMADSSPTIVVGGGEDGLPPLDEEISLGPLRVTLTYVEVEHEETMEPPAVETPDGADGMTANEVPLEDIPEEAMLPEETGLGEKVYRAPVVTVYFDEPASGETSEPDDKTAEAGAPAEEPDSDQTSPETSAETAAAPAPAGPRAVARLQGDSGGFSNPPVSLQIAQLDPSKPYPEVVVSFFTGGAHCCSVTHVIASNEDGSDWKTVDVGEFDGGPMVSVDLDGDGTHEFETRDNAFLYAFACYACSEAPLQVLGLVDGKIKDVSTEARFKPAHAAWLKNMIVGVPEQEVNGFLAGYVAQKIRLGEGKQAWELMEKYYDRNTDWGLEVCDQDLDASAECPGETTKVTFPQALERMLKKNGYMIGG